MTLLLPEGEQTTPALGISRRRVLQGVGWATPVVVIATAVPAAAAASVVELGALAFATTSAYMNATTLTVAGRFTFVGSAAALPVTSVVASIVVPTDRLTGVAPTFSGAGWTYGGAAPSGPNTVFTFNWITSDLTFANNVTTLLVVTIPKKSSVAALEVIAHGDGKSNAIVLTPITARTQATVAGSLIWNSPDPSSGGKVGSNFVLAFSTRHNGPTTPPLGGPITGITIDVSWPVNEAHPATAAGAVGWTVTDLGAAQNQGRVRFTYSGTLNAGDITTQPKPAFLAKGNKTSTTFTLTGSYTSAGGTFALPTRTVTVS